MHVVEGGRQDFAWKVKEVVRSEEIAEPSWRTGGSLDRRNISSGRELLKNEVLFLEEKSLCGWTVGCTRGKIRNDPTNTDNKKLLCHIQDLGLYPATAGNVKLLNRKVIASIQPFYKVHILEVWWWIRDQIHMGPEIQQSIPWRFQHEQNKGKRIFPDLYSLRIGMPERMFIKNLRDILPIFKTEKVTSVSISTCSVNTKHTFTYISRNENARKYSCDYN